MAGTKINEATLREALKGTENIPIVDTDLPSGRTTAAKLKEYVQPDLSDYATKTELEGKVDKTTYDGDKKTFALKTEIPDISGKQDTLVSGTNIKTINGQSVLGSGNITIEPSEGGGIEDAPSDGKTYGRKSGAWSEIVIPDTSNLATKSEVSSKADKITVVDHGTADTTFELTPNVFHKWGEVAALNLTLGAETSGVLNEYMLQFTSGTTATVLTLPETVKWISDSTIEAGKTYQVSIVNNLAVLGGA